jgi:hydrogenase maturation protein HypF
LKARNVRNKAQLPIDDKNKNSMQIGAYIIKIYGIVQGVGFRPFVYRKAIEFGIRGWVKNVGGAVEIECIGYKHNIKLFILDVVNNPPTLSRIEKIECTFIKNESLNEILSNGKYTFIIKKSNEEKGEISFVSPDIATCSKCLEDIKVKGSSRYRYAFTNCTECGPRYSIIRALPYDRKVTTMSKFPMCEKCSQEYENPIQRRFHAEPNCCSKCGPKLFLIDNQGVEIQCEDVIDQVIKLIKDGKILGLRGVGGFQLVCDARNEQSIKLLRDRKHREHKPFALMAKDIDIVKEVCDISDREEEILTGNKRPIVLLKKKEICLLPEIIAPMQNKLGVMLPYTPLHYMLFNEDLDFLIMTSGNISGRIMEYKNESAFKNLSNIADYFLMNDREIYVEEDDSVVKVIDGVERVVRRGRGYAPYISKIETSRQIIAVGGEQKSTICVCKNGYAYLSQYLGNLEEVSCYENFKYIIEHLTKLFDIKGEILVYDMHPLYSSTKYAKSQEIKKIAVQHHHAHMVSCMAEHFIYETVIGVIFDGTGFGTDAAIWGGEFFVGDRVSFQRAGHLEYVKLQGGDQAVKQPWRCAVSYLHALGYTKDEIIQDIEKEKIEAIKGALNSNLNCFLSSSIGRLFDAVAALIGIRNNISYDGQAAIELENIIDFTVKEGYSWNIKEENQILQIEYKGIIEGVIEDIKREESAAKISAKFHNSIIDASCNLVCRIRDKYNLNKVVINKVVLSGGVFENEYILKKIYINLIEKNFEVFYNHEIPTNDEGISFGQIHVASEIVKKGRIDYVPCHTSQNFRL